MVLLRAQLAFARDLCYRNYLTGASVCQSLMGSFGNRQVTGHGSETSPVDPAPPIPGSRREIDNLSENGTRANCLGIAIGDVVRTPAKCVTSAERPRSPDPDSRRDAGCANGARMSWPHRRRLGARITQQSEFPTNGRLPADDESPSANRLTNLASGGSTRNVLRKSARTPDC